MIVGIGVDVIEPERIARAMANPRFIERMYTPRERQHIAQAGANAAQRAAGIFAAKEAAVKALGCGFDGVGFHDVEVTSAASGQPGLELHGGAAARLAALAGARASVDIAHSKRGGSVCRYRGMNACGGWLRPEKACACPDAVGMAARLA